MTSPLAALRAERDWLRLCVDAMEGRRRPAPSTMAPALSLAHACLRVRVALADGPLSARALWCLVPIAPADRELVIDTLRRDGHLEPLQACGSRCPRYRLTVTR